MMPTTDRQLGRERGLLLRRAELLGFLGALLLGAAAALAVSSRLPPRQHLVLAGALFLVAALCLGSALWYSARADRRTRRMAPEHRGRRHDDWDRPW